MNNVIVDFKDQYGKIKTINAVNNGPAGVRAQMSGNFINYKELEIPYCVWNYLSTPNDGNRFSLVDDDSRRILSERLGRVLVGEE